MDELKEFEKYLMWFNSMPVVEGCSNAEEAEEYLDKKGLCRSRSFGAFKITDSHIMTVESWGIGQSNIYSFFKQGTGEYMHVDDFNGNKWWIEIENGKVKTTGVAKFYEAVQKS